MPRKRANEKALLIRKQQEWGGLGEATAWAKKKGENKRVVKGVEGVEGVEGIEGKEGKEGKERKKGKKGKKGKKSDIQQGAPRIYAMEIDQSRRVKDSSLLQACFTSSPPLSSQALRQSATPPTSTIEVPLTTIQALRCPFTRCA